MKSHLFKFTRVMVAIVAFAMVANIALAWTGPTSTFPAGDVPAPVNTGVDGDVNYYK
jgi:hypothetical protein